MMTGKEKIGSSENFKVSASSIKNIPRITSSPDGVRETALYFTPVDGVDFDIALFRSKSAETGLPLFVFFCGHVDRTTTRLPAFQRWSWHDQLPGHTLFISDPLLKRTEDLGLGWYIGTRKKDLNPQISRLVSQVATTLGTPESKIVFYGSSGGGFAALRALVEMPKAQAVAINPQVILTKFEGNSLNRYLDRFFDGMSKAEFQKSHSYRNSILSRMSIIKGSRIIYVQNTLDAHHMSEHFPLLFRKEENSWRSRYFENVELILFEDARGHGVGEPKDLLPTIISHLLLP